MLSSVASRLTRPAGTPFTGDTTPPARGVAISDVFGVLDDPGFEAYLCLGQAQCAIGRGEEGRGNFAVLEREVNRMPPAERPFVSSMIEYHKGRCSEGDFDRAEATTDRLRTGAAAILAYEGFLELAGNVSSASPELQAAIDDATQRIAALRQRIRR